MKQRESVWEVIDLDLPIISPFKEERRLAMPTLWWEQVY
jgi:hypothetical protein